jgi:hypothetical protein
MVDLILPEKFFQFEDLSTFPPQLISLFLVNNFQLDEFGLNALTLFFIDLDLSFCLYKLKKDLHDLVLFKTTDSLDRGFQAC